MNILGISAYYHDSAAALITDGEIIALAQEERFSRRKHDAAFPRQAIDYCLEEAKLSIEQIDHVVFYDKPLITFERLLDTYLSFAPRGLSSFLTAMPIWLKDKLFLKTTLKKELGRLSRSLTTPKSLLFSDHHLSHAASAFYPSPFQEAAVICMDGVGEWATTSVWIGKGRTLTPLWQLDFPHSAGLLYSAFTSYLGFRVNSGEYKLMGLAPYGTAKYVDLIKQHLLDLKADGSFRLNMKYFNFATGLTMTSQHFHDLFGGPPRALNSQPDQRCMDIAASIQSVIEEIVLRIADTVFNETGISRLCLAGGVALNCVANGRLLREGPFDEIWIQPAADDAGGALGAALSVWHDHLAQARKPRQGDAMQAAYLGPQFSNAAIIRYLQQAQAVFEQLPDETLIPKVAHLIQDGAVIGWFQGRMECGARALGNRSILADPRAAENQSRINLKIKFRESFRPFAPAVAAENASDYFSIDRDCPYMQFTCQLSDSILSALTEAEKNLQGLEQLRVKRSTLPAITHVDNSARLQTVSADSNPRFHQLLKQFGELTGYAVLVNTSFNVRGEPIVCSPADAWRCFMQTDMDFLVMGNQLLDKRHQAITAAAPVQAAEMETDQAC